MMRYKDIISEAPMVDYDMIGDPNTEGSFRPDDLAAMRNPKWLKKVETGFSRTPYDIALYLYNAPEQEIDFGDGKPKNVRKFQHLFKDENLVFVANNEIDNNKINLLIGKSGLQLQGRITVIMVENEGDGRLPLTPWIIAHRICHSLQYASITKSQIDAFEVIFKKLVSYVATLKGYESNHWYRHNNYGQGASEVFSAAKLLGTMKSAREGNYANPGDFETELVTQFLYNGRITLKRPTIYKIKAKQAAIEASITQFEHDLNAGAKAIFDAAVGRAFVL